MKLTKRQLRRIIRGTIKESWWSDNLFDLVLPSLDESDLEEVAPPDWESTVKKMKDDPKIKNPWALAWSMKKKGYKPNGKKQ